MRFEIDGIFVEDMIQLDDFLQIKMGTFLRVCSAKSMIDPFKRFQTSAKYHLVMTNIAMENPPIL